ncbi:MAG: hypothetical protein U0V70_03225 [Terriglobia bacterium]
MNDRALLRIWVLLPVIGILLAGCSKKPVTLNEAERNRGFEQMMTGATLVGHSARTGQDGISGEERYAIDKVSKLPGDMWIFQARLKYGSHEIPVPIPLQIQWAGDTPVITMTDVTIPGLGTYTARVLLYRDQYAGTWSSGSVSGQLFGKIVCERQ